MTPEQEALLERLAAHRTLGSAPRHELEWLASKGELTRYERGTLLTADNTIVRRLNVLLSGRVAIHVNRGGPRRVMEWRGGDVTGSLPYSRLVSAPGDAMVEETADVCVLDRSMFPELIRECPEMTAILVHVMVDRARHFTTSDLQVEKMASLGKLSAGLAHELNNPASAAARTAKDLISAIRDLEDASRALGAAALGRPQAGAIDALRDRCLGSVARIARTPLERADREEALADWLEGHGVEASLAAPLSDSTVARDELDELARTLDSGQLDAAIRWVAAGCYARQLAAETEAAATRMHRLVAAMKGHTFMGQAAAPAPVDVGRGIADTVTLFEHKAKAKSVSLTVDAEPDLPSVYAVGVDLGQVWSNLVENAIDAAPVSGHVAVKASRRDDSVVVRVIDNGPGIPTDIRSRIFDPFFTTKPVGQGTGLGLDIVRRTLDAARGRIEVESEPGRTEFRVVLTASPAAASPAPPRGR